jgi:hypothetical protein
VEATGLEEDLDAAGLKDPSDSEGQDSEEEDEEEKGHEEGEEGINEGEGARRRCKAVRWGGGVTGLFQDPHPHADLGLATSFALL